jgi:SOS-response transcriptional repressor LexA/DNA-binding XRE family transcriptional regulator
MAEKTEHNSAPTRQLGQEIKAWRKRHKLSQEDAADILEVQRTWISHVEHGGSYGSDFEARFDFVKNNPFPKPIHKMSSDDPAINVVSGARGNLLRALSEAGWGRKAVKELAKRTGYDYGVLYNLVYGSGRISDRMAEKIVQALPELSVGDLLEGSDSSLRVTGDDVTTGVYGQKPDLEILDSPKVDVRYVPLLSWAQAGALNAWEDAAYDHMGTLAVGIKDRRAFGLEIRGDSMEDRFHAGDRLVVSPGSPTRNGKLVVAKVSDDLGGEVMFKLYHKDGLGQVTLTSYNPAYPPLQYNIRDFAWIYPVVQVLINTL